MLRRVAPSFRSKPTEVFAERWLGQPFAGVEGITTEGGRTWAYLEPEQTLIQRGDWIVTYADGSRRVVSAKEFEREFDPVS